MSTDLDALVGALQADVNRLTETLQMKEQELQQAQERALRAMADLQNFKRRAEEDQKVYRYYALADLISRLIPLLDHFDQAVKQLEGDPGIPPAVLQGVRLMAQELWTILEKEGLTVQRTVGEPFDPHRHEAVAQVEGAEGMIIEEVRRGYEWNGKVMRPAMVKVGIRKGKDGQDGKNDKDDKNGKNGKDDKNGKDGKDDKNGKDGKDDKNGKNGKDDKNGEDGRDVKDVKGVKEQTEEQKEREEEKGEKRETKR